LSNQKRSILYQHLKTKHMKNITKIITSLIIFLISSTQALAFYSDVNSTTPYYESIKKMYEAGQLPESANFQPNAKITTDDLKEILESYGKQELNKSIKINSWRKDKVLVKHQALKIIFDVLGIGYSNFFDKTSFPFKDLNPESPIAAIAQKASEIGILESDNTAMFRMAKTVTKAEIIDYIQKIKTFDPKAVPQTTTPKAITIQLTPSTNNLSQTDQELLNNPNFKTFLDVWKKLKTEYYYKNDADFDKLILNATEGLVKDNGDIYTVFQKPDDAHKFLQVLSNEYEGVGMSLEMIDEHATIVSPFIGSPAEQAGLQAGDIIIKINDEDIRGLNLQTIVNKIKGPANTSVKITITRNGVEQTYNVKRQLINYKDVQYKTIEKNGKKIGYIQITTFSQSTYNNFVEAIKDLNNQNISGYIIDLRNNPGGYLDSAIHIIGTFVGRDKKAVELHYANGTIEPYTTNTEKIVKDLPIKILINKGSASASEILAGALKDYNIGQSIGATSFGKGSVQQLYTYKDGSLFKFTIAKWFTPNGTSIDKNGLKPNITIERSETGDNQLEQALSLIAN